MNERKFKNHRMSKKLFPTRVDDSGCHPGRKPARAKLEEILGRKLDPGTQESDTRGEWIFREPLKKTG